MTNEPELMERGYGLLCAFLHTELNSGNQVVPVAYCHSDRIDGMMGILGLSEALYLDCNSTSFSVETNSTGFDYVAFSDFEIIGLKVDTL